MVLPVGSPSPASLKKDIKRDSQRLIELENKSAREKSQTGQICRSQDIISQLCEINRGTTSTDGFIAGHTR